VPFHVRLNQKSNPSHREVKLDLAEPELEEQFLKPYREGRPIMVGGKVVPADDINYLKISFTEQPSDALLPAIRYEREQAQVIAVGSATSGVSRNRAMTSPTTSLRRPQAVPFRPRPSQSLGQGKVRAPEWCSSFMVETQRRDPRYSTFCEPSASTPSSGLSLSGEPENRARTSESFWINSSMRKPPSF
jgi:hypothetical protein